MRAILLAVVRTRCMVLHMVQGQEGAPVHILAVPVHLLGYKNDSRNLERKLN